MCSTDNTWNYCRQVNFFSHEKILTAYRENHPYNVVVLFEENVFFLFSLRQSQAPPKGQQESLQEWGIAQEKAL